MIFDYFCKNFTGFSVKAQEKSVFYILARFTLAKLQQIFYKQVIVAQTLHKIARKELDVVKLGKVEHVRFCQNGRGNIQRLTNLYHIIEKVRVRQLFGVLVYVLFADSTVRH